MPTGYTAKLYDGDQAFEEFALTAARSFGALIEMRDMGLDATVPDEFAPSSYHSERLAEAEARLGRLSVMTVAAAGVRAEQEHAAWVAERRRAEAETSARRDRYTSMRERVLAWHPPTDEHTGLRDFMLQQLDESIRFDCGDWSPPAPTIDGKVWLEASIGKAKRDIEYHTTELEADRQRAAERTAWVRTLRSSLQAEPVR